MQCSPLTSRPSTNNTFGRERLCDGSGQDRENMVSSQPQDHPYHGLQTDNASPEVLALVSLTHSGVTRQMIAFTSVPTRHRLFDGQARS